MKCIVCGTRGASPQRTAGGTFYGHACVAIECRVLAWEAYFIQVTGAPQYERDVIGWQWRRQRAAVRGERFVEPAPKSPGEKALEAVVAEHSLAAVAAELG